MPARPDPGPCLRLAFAADPVSVRNALARLLSAPPASTLAPVDRATVELVLAEVLNNVTEHAYADGSGLVEVTLTATPAGIACEVRDSGDPMPGGDLPEGRLPDGAGRPLANQPEGGFGWHLIRSFAQDLAYVRAGGQNLLSFLIPLGR